MTNYIWKERTVTDCASVDHDEVRCGEMINEADGNGHIYRCNTNGLIHCFDLVDGERLTIIHLGESRTHITTINSHALDLAGVVEAIEHLDFGPCALSRYD